MIRAHVRQRPKNPQGSGGAGAFTPALIFSPGAQGVWFDPSDLGTMFQDAAGTTPVTGADQVVGLIRDKSGRGNHASQATQASKPILRNAGALWWLEFDGVDDFLVTASIPFVSAQMATFASIRKVSDAALSVLAESSANIGLSDGTFILLAPAGNAQPTVLCGFKGTTRVDRTSPANLAAPVTLVMAGIANIAGPSTRLDVNNVTVASGVESLGTGTFLSNPLYIGRRGGTSLAFNGLVYGLVVFGDSMTSADITATQTYLGAKAGLSI